MVQAITYPAFQTIIKGRDLSPINANEILLDLRASSSTPSMSENERMAFVDALRSQSQGTLGFNVVFGGLTQIKIAISFYRLNQAYLQTASTFQGGDQVLKPMYLILNSTDISDGRYQYEFPIPPCDGIQVKVVSISGTNTGSSLTEFHLALRTN